jgi:hypothetical protein
MLVTRPIGASAAPEFLPPPEVTRELHAALLALPELALAEAGRPYRDLRLFVSEATAASVDTYLRDLVAAVRRLAPKWSPPKAATPRGPAKTPTEIKTAQRERERAAARMTSGVWLRYYLASHAEPGARVVAADLFALAEAASFDTPDATAGQFPGPRQFYAVADEILGARRYSHGSRFYIIPA